MRNRNRGFIGIIFFVVIIFSFLPVLYDTFALYFSFPSFRYIQYQASSLYYNLIVKNPLFIVVIFAIILVVVLLVCQKLEHARLERETDFIQAEHLCKTGDESMQGYADAAEIRLQKQNKISVEKYGKRAPQSRYYNN